jgi:hypothetical protein
MRVTICTRHRRYFRLTLSPGLSSTPLDNVCQVPCQGHKSPAQSLGSNLLPLGHELNALSVGLPILVKIFMILMSLGSDSTAHRHKNKRIQKPEPARIIHSGPLLGKFWIFGRIMGLYPESNYLMGLFIFIDSC